MENKPIVTCHGDQTLFSKLHPLVVRGLARETVEWKRSYGRPSRTIRVEATFVPFNPSILPDENDWTLLGRPFFHTYWTDCDVEAYKTSIKDEINDWLTSLKEKDIPDWLIITVVNDDNRVKSKILRNSVHDKIKNDFCSKIPDRCLVLAEPFKPDAKTSESWTNILSRMRHLLLDSYGRNLGHFEEHMRAQRERRTEPKWTFGSYFLLQEELAFMYEMLGLYEDALVQYDELDALFTQFVLNYAVGDTAGWLIDFSQQPTTRWDGLCLSQPINISKRQMIKRQEASLLDLRNYLFSRQCTLLFLLIRPWEAGQRAIPFMHNCIKELRILEISVPAGAVDCWVYLSCLEVLKMSDTFSHLGHTEAYSLYSANLYDYARTKISNLGNLCGLMLPDGPTSNHLHLVVELLSGLVRSEGETESLNNLKESLSSKESFHKRYLDLSEQTICSFKHIGRMRSARKVAKDLASYYMFLEKPEKAESYLLDAVKMFKSEGWEMLANDTRIDIAWCQKKTQQIQKYCRTCMYIASSPTVAKDTRIEYQRELENIGLNAIDATLMVRCAPVFYVLNIEPPSKSFTSSLSSLINLDIMLNLLQPITVDSICVSLIYWTNTVSADEAYDQSEHSFYQSSCTHSSRQASGSEHMTHSREPSGSSVVGIDLYNRIQETIQASSQPLDLHSQIELTVEDRTASSSAVVCRSPLRRLKSVPGVTKEKEVTKDEWNLLLTAKNQTLNPGKNDICVVGNLTDSGCYLVNQLCIKYRGIEFFKTLSTDCITLTVISCEPTITLEPASAPLVAGIPQSLHLSLQDKSHRISSRDFLNIITSDGLTLNSEQMSMDGTLSLIDTDENGQIELTLTAFASLNDNDVACHEVTFSGNHFQQEIKCVLTFLQLFKITHNVHSAYKKKYIQIVLVGNTDECIEILEPVVHTDNKHVSFLNLQKLSQKWMIKRNQSASFLWEMEMNNSLVDEVPILCTFQINYLQLMPDVTRITYNSNYMFTLYDYKTKYFLTSTLIDNDTDVGLILDKSYKIRLTVTRAEDADTSASINYRVAFNENAWTVDSPLEGRVQFENSIFQLTISVKPLLIGYIHLPYIQLLQQIAEKQELNARDELGSSIQNIYVTNEGLENDCEKFTSDCVAEVTESKDELIYRLVGESQVYNCSKAQQIFVQTEENSRLFIAKEIYIFNKITV